MQRNRITKKNSIRLPHLCYICGSDDLYHMYELSHGSIIRCRSCGAGRTIFKVGKNLNQEIFDQERWTETRNILASILRDEAQSRYTLLEQLSPGKNLLEIGCGTGEFLEVAKLNGHIVTGVEISGAAVKNIKSRRPDINIKHCYLHEAGFRPESFDVIVAFHLLEHIEDLRTFLSHIKFLLKPGGLFYVRVPNLDSWYRKILGKSWWGFSIEHITHFTSRGLRTLFEGESFDVSYAGSGGDDKYSYWPVLPLLYKNAVVLRFLSNMITPREMSGKSTMGTLTDGLRLSRPKVKNILMHVYLSYRRIGSLILSPMLLLQNRCGGQREAFAVAKKTRK